jgi:stage V sporulation protein S
VTAGRAPTRRRDGRLSTVETVRIGPGVIRQSGKVEVQIVGAGALNQAIKALAIARGYVAEAGVDLVCVPTFADIEIDGERRTAIRLHIDDRQHRMPDPALLRDVPIVLDGHRDFEPSDDGVYAARHD